MSDRTPRLLVAADFSDASREAARVAARLAARPEDVVVAHAVPLVTTPALVGVPGVGGPALPAAHFLAPAADPDAGIEAALRAWADESGLPGARVEVVSGASAAALARLASETRSDLVLAGATGRSGFERALLGTTATALLHESEADVMLVRGRAPPPSEPLFPRVVVGADLAGDAFARRARPHLRALRRAGADIVLVHVADRTLRGMAMEPEEAGRRLHALNERLLDGAARERLDEGRPAEALRRVAEEARASLLVIGDVGAGGLERLLLGSVSSALVEKAPCSVLVLKTAS